VAAALGWRVEDHEFDDGTNGDCHRGERRIRVEAGNAPAQRVKTLVHELAHALLHAETGSRVLAELEAESTAYVVCRALGIDSGRYSFGYVATWAGGGDAALEGIRQSCGRIQSAASTLLTALDRAAAITGG
jgi:antirestriction protein ArdC